MTLEINTTRGVAKCFDTVRSHIKNFHNAMLILPTRGEIPLPELRRQDTKNRQNL